MFEASTLDGIPYLSYIPRPVLPAISDYEIKRFQQLDMLLAAEHKIENFIDAYVEVVLLNTVRKSDENAYERARLAVDYALKVRVIGKKHLIKFNQLLVGHNDETFRQRPVWLGATHPAYAWFVGSPANKLENLVDQVFKVSNLKLPASLVGLISLFRLLSIHPFSDGNGRTTRLYVIQLIHRTFGPSMMYLELLEALWDRPQFDMHAVSLAMRDREDWSELFDYCFSIIEIKRKLYT